MSKVSRKKNIKKSSNVQAKKNNKSKKNNKTNKIEIMRGGANGPLSSNSNSNGDDWNSENKISKIEEEQKQLEERKRSLTQFGNLRITNESNVNKVNNVDNDNGYFVTSTTSSGMKQKKKVEHGTIGQSAREMEHASRSFKKHIITKERETIDIRTNIDKFLEKLPSIREDIDYKNFKANNMLTCPNNTELKRFLKGGLVIKETKYVYKGHTDSRLVNKNIIRFEESSPEISFINSLCTKLKERKRNDIKLIISGKATYLLAELFKYILYIILTGIHDWPDIPLAQFLLHDSKTKLEEKEINSNKQIGLAFKYIQSKYPEMKPVESVFNWSPSL